MARLRKLSVVVLLLVCIVSTSEGSAIHIEGSPSTVKEGLTKNVRLTCSLNDTASSSGIIGRRGVTASNILDSTSGENDIASFDEHILPRSDFSDPTTETPYNVDEIMSIIVTQHGADIAAVTHTHPPKVKDNSTNLQVSGHILNAASGQGFIQLTWQNPSVAELDGLECHVTAMDQAGHGVAFTQTIEYDVSMPTIMDVVTHMTQLEKENEAAVNSLNARLASSISRVSVLETEKIMTNTKLSTLQSQVAVLETGTVTINNTLSTLENENNAMKATIGHIRHIETGRVGVDYEPVHLTGTGTGTRDKSIAVKFQHTYDKPPKIVLGTVKLDMEDDKNVRYEVDVQNIDINGFEVKFRTWADTVLYRLSVDWVSIPA